MSDFSIQFTYPWLLLLIIPIIGVALFLHLRINKKFRRSRNRIISLVLHCVTGVLCVLVLSGMQFAYSIPNDKNEVIFLVDVSDSYQSTAEQRDEFVENVIEAGRYTGVKMGVVTFGFDQVYAVPLTDDIDSVYEGYVNAALPDQRGTNIADALSFAADQFENPASAKIVLITDGKETDEDATAVISGIAAYGVSVDTVQINSGYSGNDVQIMDVSYPEYHLDVDEKFNLVYSLYSNAANTGVIKMYDNNVLAFSETIQVASGLEEYEKEYTFTKEGLHELRFEISINGDLLDDNNVYYSYYNVERFDKVLVLESREGQSTQLDTILKGDGKYDTTVLNLNDPEDIAKLPATAVDLCEYDQVILNNVAVTEGDYAEYSDLPAGYVDVLYSYVYDYGGGMLTVGGDDENGNSYAYNQNWLYGTTYQSMLPVQAVTYVPPIAVMLIVDISGSMVGTDDTGTSKLSWAKAGARACLDVLNDRDYIGIMTLAQYSGEVLGLTPRVYDTEIRNAINSIDSKMGGGGTVFSTAIANAASALQSQNNVARKHIMIVSDGQLAGDKEAAISEASYYYNTFGITLSVVGVGLQASDSNKYYVDMKELTRAAGGEEAGSNLYAVSDLSDLTLLMTGDLTTEEIRDVNIGEFNPSATNKANNIFEGVTFTTVTESDEETGEETQYTTNYLTAELGGFYGARARSAEYQILSGPYNEPIYAQWKFGAGTVGSFMSDLGGGKWSSDFMSDEGGRRFIVNMVDSIMPVNDIQPDPFEVSVDTDNLITRLSVYADLQEGQYISGKIARIDSGGEDGVEKQAEGQTPELYSVSLNTSTGEVNRDTGVYVTTALGASNSYSRSTFVLREPGLYELTLNLCDAEGNVISTFRRDITFSYSKEYDTSLDQSLTEVDAFLSEIAVSGNGQKVLDLNDPSEVFSDFVTETPMEYDPRIPILVTAIILFLLDVAVRKFKFKWIHEIIRERKEKKAMERDVR